MGELVKKGTAWQAVEALEASGISMDIGRPGGRGLDEYKVWVKGVAEKAGIASEMSESEWVMGWELYWRVVDLAAEEGVVL